MFDTNDRQLAKELRTRRQHVTRVNDLFGVTTLTVALFLLTLCLRFDTSAARTADVLKVELAHGGVLVGRHRTSHSGRHIRAFMGVPYALPPVGELRFKVCSSAFVYVCVYVR